MLGARMVVVRKPLGVCECNSQRIASPINEGFRLIISSLNQALSRLSIETGSPIYFRLALSASLSQRSAVATDGDHAGSIIGGVNRP